MNLLVIGDRVLIKPKSPDEKTKAGLYLPPSVQQREKVQSGYVIKVGPGYPIPVLQEDEPWKQSQNEVKYIPLQVRPGDLALFLQKEAIEIQYQSETYFLLPQNAILLIERDNELTQ